MKYTEKVITLENPPIQNATMSALIYSKEGCSYCTMAKTLLEKKGIKVESIELGNNHDLFTKLVNQTGQKTVPYIFINGNFIGGFHDLKSLYDSSNL